MGSYVLNRQDTVAQYIGTRPIMDLYRDTVRRPGAWVARRWWEQDGMELLGARSTEVEEVDREGGSEGEEEDQ